MAQQPSGPPTSPFIGPTYALSSRPASVQRTINMTPVPLEPGNDRSGWVLRDIPGLVNLTTQAGIVAEFSDVGTGLTFVFTDLTVGNPNQWAWDFGDGGTSTLQNPTHTYAADGTYTVTLTATNAANLTGRVSHPVSALATNCGFGADPFLFTLSNFNRTATHISNSWASVSLNEPSNSGKRYWEFIASGIQGSDHLFGVIAHSALGGNPTYPANPFAEPTYGVINGSNTGVTLGVLTGTMTNGVIAGNAAYSFAKDDVIGLAVDFTTFKLWIAKNNVWYDGNPATGTSPTFVLPDANFAPYAAAYNKGYPTPGTVVINTNVAVVGFVYTPPAGFTQWC